MWTRKQLFLLFILVGSAVVSLLFVQHITGLADSGQTERVKPQNLLASSTPSIRITPTKLLLRPSGFTLYDRLYVRNGTVYAVTDDGKDYPDLKHIIAKGLSGDLGVSVDPTDEEMRIITPTQATHILGDTALVIGGMAFIMYDSTQFMAHYYHWWGEIMLGAMRVYAGLSLLPEMAATKGKDEDIGYGDVKRFLLPNVHDHRWRDYAGVNGPFMRAAFPSAVIERSDYWEDLKTLGRTFVFERAMIVSREAAHKHPLASEWFKMISSTLPIPSPPHFFEPLRRRLVRNLVGYLPILNSQGAVVSSGSGEGLQTSVPIVLYVSRQGGWRRLLKADHEALQAALRDMCLGQGKKLCEFVSVQLEEWEYKDQVEIVARSTIMVGVHGNGLTHQLWMPPSRRSTVIEIFYPKTYLHDYEILARNVGHKHYAVWNDTTITYAEGEWFPGVEGGIRENFHGDSIPVHGQTVAEVVRRRLTDDTLSF